MGKNDIGGTKAIAKKIKAKGLQKLRWYCQMCEKQCRDENGFKCHCSSEGHLRQMELFRERPKQIVQDYSKQFLIGFMSFLKVKGQTRVRANQVYNEYIKDRTHIHMNSTQWSTLSGFVQYLGATGRAMVEETPRGWYVTYIDNDPAKRLKIEEEQKKEKIKLSEEEREEKRMAKIIREAHEKEKQNEVQDKKLEIKEEKKNENDKPIGKVSFSLGNKISFGLNKIKEVKEEKEEKREKTDKKRKRDEEEEELPRVNEEEELPRIEDEEEEFFIKTKKRRS